MKGKKTKTTSNETATTTPNIYGPAQGAIQNYYGKIDGLMGLGADSVVAPSNALQQRSELAAQKLGQSSQGYTGAMDTVKTGLAGLLNANGATATNVTPIGALNAVNAKAPTAIRSTDVANINGPAVSQAGLSYIPTAAQATDTSGLAGKDVATYGGAAASGYINNYLDPYLKDNVAASMAAFDDNAGREQADYAAKGALNKAFGGSRFGIGEAQLLSDQTRNRALTDAQLRSDAWGKALGAAQGDASNANSAGIASMQATNQRDEMLGSLAAQLGMFNAGQKNDINMGIFDAQNEFGLFNAGAQNTANNAKFSVDAANAQANAASTNDINKLIYGTNADINQSNVAGQNTANNLFYSTQADIAKQDAAAKNQTSQFNANFGLDKAQGVINGGQSLASILGQQGDAQRADLSLQSQLGNSQYAREQAQQLAPYTQAQILSELLNGGGLLGQTSGQTITSNGTSTSKQSGGLLQSLLASSAQLGSAAIMASERRVKRDIMKLGEEADGLGVYAYNYIWDDAIELPRFGVMVDEVERIRPWALGPVVDGVQTVNYGAL